jgi:outer membrane lipoprotein-sorting protein
MTAKETIEQKLEKLAQKIASNDKLVENVMSHIDTKTTASSSAVTTQNIWRTSLKNPMTKYAAAAAIIIAMLIGIRQFGGSINVANVTFADVLENIRNTKTLTFMVRANEKRTTIMKVMVFDPYVSRIEFLSEQIPSAPIIGGQIWIVDTGQGKSLVLDTVKKTGKVYPSKREMLDTYDTFRNFRDRVDFSVEEIGNRQIDDKKAIGFKLTKENENHEIIVWADSKTELPVLIEEKFEDAEGRVMQYVVTDIVFDVELDQSLFSLEPPKGYKLQEFEYDPSVKRLISAVNMDRIMKACRKYVNKHSGQWPDSLKELTAYGLDKDVFINPGQPAREAVYVYLKPPAFPSESRIVLYEAYNVWNGGINVGLANYHIEFIGDESDFNNRLAEDGQRSR